MSVADHQTLRVLEGRYVLERAASDVEVARDGEVLAVVRGPDGGACMRRLGGAVEWRRGAPAGRDRHVGCDRGAARSRQGACLGRGQLRGDIVLIPVDQVDEASELLRRAGHRVMG
jgi:hypothetical protein